MAGFVGTGPLGFVRITSGFGPFKEPVDPLKVAVPWVAKGGKTVLSYDNPESRQSLEGFLDLGGWKGCGC
jgi:hypothetical protein